MIDKVCPYTLGLPPCTPLKTSGHLKYVLTFRQLDQVVQCTVYLQTIECITGQYTKCIWVVQLHYPNQYKDLPVQCHRIAYIFTRTSPSCEPSAYLCERIGVRFFPKGIFPSHNFPSDNFPRGNFPKIQLSVLRPSKLQ